MTLFPPLRKHHVRQRLAGARERPSARGDFRLFLVVLLRFRLLLFQTRRFLVLLRPLRVQRIRAFAQHPFRLTLQLVQLSRAQMTVIDVAGQPVHRLRRAIANRNLLLHGHLPIVQQILILHQITHLHVLVHHRSRLGAELHA